MTPEEVEALFTRSDGSYYFSRWGRPIVPVVFGLDDKTLTVVKGAIEAVVTLANHKMAETDPELGANLIVFFLREWDELANVPNLDQLLLDLTGLVDRLESAGANQYRQFRFDEGGAIKACFVFIRIDQDMREQSADILALGQMVRAILAWGDQAFSEVSPLAQIAETGVTILKPEIADVIRASYNPLMPDATTDRAHALRIFARLEARI